MGADSRERGVADSSQGRSRSRSGGRTLARTVFIGDAGSVTPISYEEGTPESDIPAEHLERITNPKAWGED